MTFGAFSLAIDSAQLGATDLSALRMPLVIPQGIWAGGFALMMLAGVALACRAVVQLRSGQLDALDVALSARTYQDEAQETLAAVAGAPK